MQSACPSHRTHAVVKSGMRTIANIRHDVRILRINRNGSSTSPVSHEMKALCKEWMLPNCCKPLPGCEAVQMSPKSAEGLTGFLLVYDYEEVKTCTSFEDIFPMYMVVVDSHGFCNNAMQTAQWGLEPLDNISLDIKVTKKKQSYRWTLRPPDSLQHLPRKRKGKEQAQPVSSGAGDETKGRGEEPNAHAPPPGGQDRGDTSGTSDSAMMSPNSGTSAGKLVDPNFTPSGFLTTPDGDLMTER